MAILLLVVGIFVLVGVIVAAVLFVLKRADRLEKAQEIDEDRPTQIEG